MMRDELTRRVAALLVAIGEPEDTVEVTLRPNDAAGWIVSVTRPDAAPHVLDACAMAPTEADACAGAWRQIVRRIEGEAESQAAYLRVAERSLAQHRLELARLEALQTVAVEFG